MRSVPLGMPYRSTGPAPADRTGLRRRLREVAPGAPELAGVGGRVHRDGLDRPTRGRRLDHHAVADVQADVVDLAPPLVGGVEQQVAGFELGPVHGRAGTGLV